jgi:predicted nucleic acid-binding protein
VIVVSDSSPLILLSKVGLLELLPRLFGKIIITPEVYSEVVVLGAGLAGAGPVSEAQWIEVRPLANPAQLAVEMPQHNIGPGELSVILLSVEIGDALLLLDDLSARKPAQTREISILGCIGVLEIAFRGNLLADLRESYRQLLAAGAHIDMKTVNRISERFHISPL